MLRHTPHELEKEIEKVEHTVREGVEEIEQKAKHILPSQSSHDDDGHLIAAITSELQHRLLLLLIAESLQN
jgi:hypothetical protein